MKANTMFCALGLSVMALFFCTSTTAATSDNLFDMMEQLDKSDKQDFQSAIDKANACTRARNFQCSATELARAAKTANSGQDKKILLASQNSLANEQQQVANEIRRAEEARQAQIRRAEEARQAQIQLEEQQREAQIQREEQQRQAQARAEEAAEDRRQTAANISGFMSILGATASNYAELRAQQRATANLGNNKLADLLADTDRRARESRQQQVQADALRQEQARAAQERAQLQAAQQARLQSARSNTPIDLPKYQPQVATISSVQDKCPPGSSPARQANGQYVTIPPTAYCVKDPQGAPIQSANSGGGNGSGTGSGNSSASGSGTGSGNRSGTASGAGTGSGSGSGAGSGTGSGNSSGSGNGTTFPVNSGTTSSNNPPVAVGGGGNTSGNGTVPKKVIYGPEQLEAVAICWQNSRNPAHWRCDGPTQDTIDSAESLEVQLGYAGCSNPRLNDGSRSIATKSGGAPQTAMVYLCGYGLWYETDVVKKYGITVQRNKYQCTGSTYPTSKCKDNYQMTN